MKYKVAYAGFVLALSLFIIGADEGAGCLGTDTSTTSLEAACKQASDCEGLVHAMCVGRWLCESGKCSWDCSAGQSCKTDADCANGAVPAIGCADGTPPVQVCKEGKCGTSCGTPVSCYSDKECPEGFICQLDPSTGGKEGDGTRCGAVDAGPAPKCIVQGVCVKKPEEVKCQSDADCPKGFFCALPKSGGEPGKECDSPGTGCVPPPEYGICLPVDDCNCTKEYKPVCGTDGKTYGNPCFARCARVGILHEGECKEQPCECYAMKEGKCGVDFACKEGFQCDPAAGACCRCVPPPPPVKCEVFVDPIGSRCEKCCTPDGWCKINCESPPVKCEPFIDPAGVRCERCCTMDGWCKVFCPPPPIKCEPFVDSNGQKCEKCCDEKGNCKINCGPPPIECKSYYDSAGNLCQKCCDPSGVCKVSCEPGVKCEPFTSPEGQPCQKCCDPKGNCWTKCEPPVLKCLSDADCPKGFYCEPLYKCDPNTDPAKCPGSEGVCKPLCQPVTCDLWCQYGFIKDENGCEICKCAEPPVKCEEYRDSTTGAVCKKCCDAAGKCEIFCSDPVCNGTAACSSDTDCPYMSPIPYICVNGCCTQKPPECNCITLFDPVCGSDGITYSNECVAKCHGVGVAYKGPCRESCIETFAACNSDMGCPSGTTCVNGACCKVF